MFTQKNIRLQGWHQKIPKCSACFPDHVCRMRRGPPIEAQPILSSTPPNWSHIYIYIYMCQNGQLLSDCLQVPIIMRIFRNATLFHIFATAHLNRDPVWYAHLQKHRMRSTTAYHRTISSRFWMRNLQYQDFGTSFVFAKWWRLQTWFNFGYVNQLYHSNTIPKHKSDAGRHWH